MDLPKPEAEFKLMTLVIKLRRISLDLLSILSLCFFMEGITMCLLIHRKNKITLYVKHNYFIFHYIKGHMFRPYNLVIIRPTSKLSLKMLCLMGSHLVYIRRNIKLIIQSS